MVNNSFDSIKSRIISAIYQGVNLHSSFVVAIDGRCAAGKTTFAEQLRTALIESSKDSSFCTVFHMDDFFLRPEQRTPERLAQPGGNIDYERFFSEVMAPVKEGKPVIYRRYDCHTRSMSDTISVLSSSVMIIEGVYSCHPQLWDFYDMRIFLDIDAKEQQKRILLRNGEEMLRRFTQEWIPLEEQYFAAYSLKSRCDFYF